MPFFLCASAPWRLCVEFVFLTRRRKAAKTQSRNIREFRPPTPSRSLGFAIEHAVRPRWEQVARKMQTAWGRRIRFRIDDCRVLVTRRTDGVDHVPLND